MTKSILALYPTREHAEHAVQDLVNTGFPRNNIHLESGRELVAGKSRAEEPSGLRKFLMNLGLAADEGPDTRIGGFQVFDIQPEEAVVFINTADNVADRAAEIMDRHDAIDIDERIAKHAHGGSETEPGRASAPSEETKIPVVEEELQVGKRPVTHGGVRVHARVVEQPAEEQVRLREEKVRVERRRVDRPVSEGEIEAFKEGSIELAETHEEPVVSKRARVKEEVSISKEATERTETIRDTVRGTEVQVESLSPDEAQEFAAIEDDLRNDYQTMYAPKGVIYEQIRPIYQYGYRLSRDPRYHRAGWSEIESDVRSEWDEDHYGPWDQYKGAVRSGWERAIHRRR